MATYLVLKNELGGVLDAKKVEDGDIKKTFEKAIMSGDWVLSVGDTISILDGTYNGSVFTPEQ